MNLGMKKFILALSVLLLFSCADKKNAGLENEEMFTLCYSKLDDGIYPSANNRICMNDGFFYITDGAMGKMMKFNSYGDLLILDYNTDKNKKQLLVARNDGTKPSNKASFPTDFVSPKQIAVNNDQSFFVADTLNDYQNLWSPDLNCMLTDTVNCFDMHGKLIAKLGQTGLDSDPFPPVIKLETTDNMELAVHTLSPVGQIIYLFDRELKLLHTVRISAENIPLAHMENQIISLDSISCSKTDRLLFIKVDYYVGKDDDIEFLKSSVCCYDIFLENILWSIDIPESDTLYQLLGVNGKDRIFMISPTEDAGYNLLIMDGNRGKLANTPLEFSFNNVQQSDITLSNQGIIAGLFAYEDKVSVVWWRSDKLLREEN